MINKKLMLKYLIPPDSSSITMEKWKYELRVALVFGCEWLDIMIDKFGGNIMADAIMEMVERLDNEQSN